MLRIISLILLMILAATAHARGSQGREHERGAPPRERVPETILERVVPGIMDQRIKAAIDARQAAAAVKQRYEGTILSIRLMENKGPPVYRVKTLSTAGVVKVVFVDGQTGEVYE